MYTYLFCLVKTVRYRIKNQNAFTYTPLWWQQTKAVNIGSLVDMLIACALTGRFSVEIYDRRSVNVSISWIFEIGIASALLWA